jgi:hypothetical protein
VKDLFGYTMGKSKGIHKFEILFFKFETS